MAITNADIKLMQPERLSDNDDGGGQMTGNEVIDGDINNLFEDISRVNRTYGNTSLRKAYLKVDTPTADLYLDAHSILSAQPADPNVSGLLFTTRDFYDERSSARQRIESFVVQGPVTGLNLRGNQLQGQKSIICYAPSINNVIAPEIGETLMLQEGDDLSSQQFIKILDVEESQETFTYSVAGGEIRTFRADQYILQLSADLKRDFPADDPHPSPSSATKIYSTQPATSANYFGTTTLAAQAAAGATSVQVNETFAPIIPTASSETPVIDQRPGGYLSQVVPSGSNEIDLNVTVSTGTTSSLPTALVPGSLSLAVGGNVYTDKGGAFVNGSGEPGALEGTVIDYRTGSIAWAGSESGSGTLSFRPGALRQQLPNTGRIDIDETNRNFNYVLSLDPAPAPTSLHVSYQYLGKWYELKDDGTGNLTGDGSGQVAYDTGSIVITLQAQPDASSTIFYRWTEPGLYDQALDAAFASTTPVNLRLDHGNVKPSTVTITWTSGGTERTATDPLGDGAISGDATGTIDYKNGSIRLTAAPKPDSGTDWEVQYTHTDDPDLTAATTVADNTTQSDITLQTEANIEPGTVSFYLRKSVKRTVVDENGIELSVTYRNYTHRLTDNGNGNIIDRRVAEAVGTVDYSTGEIIVAGNQFLKSFTAE